MLPELKVLAKGKTLRGTWLDPFSRSAERRDERALIGEYEALVELAISGLSAPNFDAALALAAWPDQIRDFGPVKQAGIAAARQARPGLIAAFEQGAPAGGALAA